jgi:hypothetical protein
VIGTPEILVFIVVLFFLYLIAKVLFYLLKWLKNKTSNLKPCPFCAEKIQAKAKICRFCNREITA